MTEGDRHAGSRPVNQQQVHLNNKRHFISV
jgi:hypothetical protein